MNGSEENKEENESIEDGMEQVKHATHRWGPKGRLFPRDEQRNFATWLLFFNSMLIGNAISVSTKVSMTMQNWKEWMLVNLLDLMFLLME